MKDADETIGRVLAGLREVQSVPGLEERMERRVRKAAGSRVVRGGWVWRGFGGLVTVNSMAGGLVACGVVLVLVTSVGLRGHRHGVPRTMDGGLAVVAARSEDDPERGKAAAHGPTVAGVKRKASLPAVQKDDRCIERRLGCGIGEREETDASFPAPPMPLTEQERLLLRVAHHGGPEEVAMLDAAMQAAQDGEETAAFQEFFGKPEAAKLAVQQINQGESR